MCLVEDHAAPVPPSEERAVALVLVGVPLEQRVARQQDIERRIATPPVFLCTQSSLQP